MEREDQGAMPYVGAAIVVIVILAITVQATVGWSEVGAAWVQAVGSVLALVVAILVPARMRMLDQRSREHDATERAFVRAMHVMTKIYHLHSAAKHLAQDIRSLNVSKTSIQLNDHLPFWDVLELPTEDEVLAMIPLQQSVAADIALVVGYIRTVQTILKRSTQLRSDAAIAQVVLGLGPTVEEVLVLLKSCSGAMTEFIEARRLGRH